MIQGHRSPVSNLHWEVRNLLRTLDARGGMRASRRIEGYVSDANEYEMFSSLAFLIEAGCVCPPEAITRCVRTVLEVQYGGYQGETCVTIQVLGAAQPVQEQRFLAGGLHSTRRISEELIRLAALAPAPEPASTPTLAPTPAANPT